MVNAQLEITGGFGESTDDRTQRIQSLQSRAQELYKQWADAFGPHDTPVPIDRGWNELSVALEKVQYSRSESHIDLAVEYLDEASWVIATETNTEPQRTP